MSRRSIAGAGLLAIAGVLYATAPTERNDAAPMPVVTQARVESNPASTVVPKDTLPKPIATAPVTKPVALAETAPAKAETTLPASAAQPTFVNGPTAGQARAVPKSGPKNADVPPALPATTVVSPVAPRTEPPATTMAKAVGVTQNRTIAHDRDLPVRAAAAKPAVNRSISTRQRPVMTADASPAPRTSPAPRVQW